MDAVRIEELFGERLLGLADILSEPSQIWPLLASELMQRVHCEGVRVLLTDERGGLTAAWSKGPDRPDEGTRPSFRPKSHETDDGSVLAFPFFAGGAVRGVVELRRKRGGFTRRDARAVETIAPFLGRVYHQAASKR